MPGDENKNIGKQIGSNYRIVAELGGGSFGDVYKAQHIVFTNRPPVAIKLLRASLRSPKECDHFIQEAQILNALSHSHILPILDAGMHEEDQPYIVMEYAPGGSLQDRLDKNPDQPLPINEAITLIIQIGEALHYAHQQNIVHRDLKPDNILFNAKGEALLADFGLATILSSARTTHIDSAGTPAYMAPEMFAGNVSVKSDQYTLGCIAYELLTGHKPLEVQDVPIYAAQYQHAYVEPIAPSQFNQQVPPHIERAILTAMAKDRKHRHADIHGFLTALQTLKSTQEEVSDSQKAWIYTQKGIAMRNTRQEEAALAAHDQAIQLSPNDPWVLYEKAITLRAFKRCEEALPVHDQAIHANPNDAWAYVEKAITLRDLKRYREALVTFDQALQLRPEDANILTQKAITIRNFTDYE